jgi:hypothetical protein
MLADLMRSFAHVHRHHHHGRGGRTAVLCAK